MPKSKQSGDAVAAIQGGSDGNRSDEGVAESESDAKDEANGSSVT